jgi:hypothetical protein
MTAILFKLEVQKTRQNLRNEWRPECTRAKRPSEQSCERAASSEMNHAIHFEFAYFAEIGDGGTRMIHHCKGLITQNKNEKIAAGKGDSSSVLESQKRRSANY